MLLLQKGSDNQISSQHSDEEAFYLKSVDYNVVFMFPKITFTISPSVTPFGQQAREIAVGVG